MSTNEPLPETRYADSGGLSIAYQVLGRGERDLVIVPPIISHLDEGWRAPTYAAMLLRFAQVFRVIQFDKRGQGLSDRFDGVPTLEDRMDDLRAVMQATGSAVATLFASSEGGAMAALFAASHPSLVDRLVLYAAMAKFTRSADYPHMPTLQQHLDAVSSNWGTPASVRGFAPSMADEPVFVEVFARWQRQSASPGPIKRLMLANDQIDLRAVLPQIRRPTLIIQRRGDRVVRSANGRFLADHIPGATHLELPGVDHIAPAGDTDAIVDAVCDFGARRAQPAAAAAGDR